MTGQTHFSFSLEFYAHCEPSVPLELNYATEEVEASSGPLKFDAKKRVSRRKSKLARLVIDWGCDQHPDCSSISRLYWA